MSLTALGVTRLKEVGRYGDGHGLYLQITGSGVKSWLLRYERAGRERWLGLGPLHTVSLQDARERARKARLQLLDGIDPIEARKRARTQEALAKAKSITFEEATTQYFDANERRWKNPKHRAQFISSLRTYSFPTIGKLPVSEIDRGLVLQVLDPIWQEKTETASRIRGRIERVLDWATVRGFRSGENPARWRGHLEHALAPRSGLAKPQHHSALPYRDLPAFMPLIRGREGVAARALEFTILTAARTGEVIGAVWDEIDLQAKVWTVPAGRMKAKKGHRVPLSDRALEILRTIPREQNNLFVFIGPRAGGLSNMAMASVLHRMGRYDITVHGFRSTFRDWAAERTAYENHVVEQALAHTIGSAVERGQYHCPPNPAGKSKGLELFGRAKSLTFAKKSTCG